MMRKKIGEIAVDKNWLTAEERNEILALQKRRRDGGESIEFSLFGKLLIEQGVCSEPMVQELLSQQNTSTEFLFYSLKSGGVPFSFGGYVVEDFIAEGGMGDVYKARDAANRKFALKTINWSNYNNKLKKRFLREIATLMELNRPNIVPVYDYGQINGIDFLLMEYLHGPTLAQALEQKSYSYRQWLAKFVELLKAIQVIHKKNIIHRDLKPSNIILTEEQCLVLIDFGLSKDITKNDYSSVFTTHPIGTPAYMAPEQILGDEELDSRTDIWALGVILYQILTQKRPFYDKNPQRLAQSVQLRKQKSICEHDPTLPPQLDIICSRALEKDKNNRYQSSAEMAADIARFLRGESIVQPKTKILPGILQINNIVDNRYKILDQLGKGGTGTVYKVEDMQQKSVLALKVLHPYLLQNEHFRRRFLHEAEMAVAFCHPHALAIHDFGECPAGLYFTMELCRKGSLKALLAEHGILPEAKALRIIRQILQVLQSAHDKAILHLNLKPANIMIENRGNDHHALVADIGIAKISSNPDSVYYISPEQVGGDELDKRTDIYVTGVLLYEMVAGRPPFEGDTQMEIFTRIISDGHFSARQANPNISAAMEKIIAKALEKDRSKRFATAREFIAAVDHCCD